MTRQKYTVSTGPRWKVEVMADTPRAAIIAALKKKAPRTLGYIIQASRGKKDDNPSYMDSMTALREAGYNVPEEGENGR